MNDALENMRDLGKLIAGLAIIVAMVCAGVALLLDAFGVLFR